MVLCENHASRAAARKFHLMRSEKSAKPLDLIRNLVRAISSCRVADRDHSHTETLRMASFKQRLPGA
jgi:hypothetical protein